MLALELLVERRDERLWVDEQPAPGGQLSRLSELSVDGLAPWP